MATARANPLLSTAKTAISSAPRKTPSTPLLFNTLRLSVNSPAVNAGDRALLPADTLDLDGDGDLTEPIPFDLDGNTRVSGGALDMGAYEYAFAPIPGDLNDDYRVNSDDLNVIRINWGRTVPRAASSTAILPVTGR